MIKNLSEREVVKAWQRQLLDGTGLVSEGGESIEIIYPGRINDGQGADFRDAVVATKRGLIKGDIEVHVKSSDWLAHRHHRDAVYNRVILHLVMWHNTQGATRLENGSDIPVLALDKYIRIPVSQRPNLESAATTMNVPCCKVGRSLSTGTMIDILDRAGEERFLAKAARMQVDLARMEASQSLYQEMMGALGYSKNKLPFLELARRLPLRILESVTQGEMSDEERLGRQQALLLGTAGLLPSQCRDRRRENGSDSSWMDELERFWAFSPDTEVMSPDDWHLFKVRPSNSPTRRLVAMSHLLLRYREGILEALIRLVKAVPLSRGYHRLEKGLLVTTEGYWASHFDFGSGSRIRSPTLLGSGRAADISVNVLLPFAFAWGQLTSRPELERKALDLYYHYPRLMMNSVERHMTVQLGLRRNFVTAARWQQGLIHIYNSRCTQGRCRHCPLGHLKAGNHVQS